MADDANTLDIVIRTTAELEGARAVEAQLERVLPHGQVLPQGQTEEEPGNHQPVEAGAPAGQVSPRGQGMETPGGEQAWEPSESTGDDGGQTGTATESGNEEPYELAAQETRNTPDLTGAGQPLTPTLSPSDGAREKNAGDNFPAPSQPAGVGTFQIEGGFERQAEALAQATLAAGSQLRAALDRNGQATVALLNRTLELMEEQNRRLDGVERRVAELAGQIKSVKNR